MTFSDIERAMREGRVRIFPMPSMAEVAIGTPKDGLPKQVQENKDEKRRTFTIEYLVEQLRNENAAQSHRIAQLQRIQENKDIEYKAQVEKLQRKLSYVRAHINALEKERDQLQSSKSSIKPVLRDVGVAGFATGAPDKTLSVFSAESVPVGTRIYIMNKDKEKSTAQ